MSIAKGYKEYDADAETASGGKESGVHLIAQAAYRISIKLEGFARWRLRRGRAP